MKKISISSLEYFSDKLYKYHGLEFQKMFNQIMQRLDNQFYAIKQKRYFGNYGLSHNYKTQFACYSPEKDNELNKENSQVGLKEYILSKI